MHDTPDLHTQPPLFDLGEVPRLADLDFARRVAALPQVPSRSIDAVADLDFERSRRRFAEGA